MVVWLALLVVGLVVIRPALTARTEQARSRLSAGLGVSHLLLVVALWLMVFQPGL
jgi:hypothetical protein